MAYGGCAVLRVLPRHITEAILIVAAYLIPNVLLSILGISSRINATVSYANPLIFLFMVGFFTAIAAG